MDNNLVAGQLAGQAQVRVPAHVLANTQNTTNNVDQYAGLSVFTNPVAGHTDTGVTHTGDLGGAA